MTGDLRGSVESNSDQLNADDLIGITRIIRVTDVKLTAGKDRPLWIYFVGDKGKPYKPNLTMRKLLIYAWGSHGPDWIGRSMELYNDPETTWAGQKVGGIKISRISHVEKDIKILLQVTKGKRAEFTVRRLPIYQTEAFEANKAVWVSAIKAEKLDLETLIDKVSATGILTDEQIKDIENAIQAQN